MPSPDDSLADPAPSHGPRDVRAAGIIGDMKRVVGAQLDVDITAPTTLEFQIAVAPHPNTQVFESLSFVLNGKPVTPMEISGVHGNRIHKFEGTTDSCCYASSSTSTIPNPQCRHAARNVTVTYWGFPGLLATVGIGGRFIRRVERPLVARGAREPIAGCHSRAVCGMQCGAADSLKASWMLAGIGQAHHCR